MFDLKKACPNCKKETVQKYKRDLVRLFKLTQPNGELPDKGSWLKSETLFKKYKAIPLNSRRQLSVAAVKGLRAYGLKHDTWNTAMVDDITAYKKQRGKQKLSKIEKEKWPEGYPVMKKMSTEYKREIRRILQGPASIKGLYAYSQALILRWYAEIPWRNDLVTVVVKGDGNLLSKKKGTYSVKMKNFKSSDKIGVIDVSLSKAPFGFILIRTFLV